MVALAIPWLPDAAGEEAQRIDFVFWFVDRDLRSPSSRSSSAVIVYSVWKFRAGPDDDSDGPPMHGHTGLEIVWTAIPAVLVTAISIVSAIVLAQNGNAGSNPLQIVKCDSAQQFAWTFTYPNGKTLRLPRRCRSTGTVQARHHRRTTSSTRSGCPQFAQKQDAVPGQHNKLVITPTSSARSR